MLFDCPEPKSASDQLDELYGADRGPKGHYCSLVMGCTLKSLGLGGTNVLRHGTKPNKLESYAGSVCQCGRNSV